MKIPVSLEDEASRELPTAAELYKPIRQTVYSVLLNLNKLKIIYENQVKEKGKLWDTCTCGKEYLTFDSVCIVHWAVKVFMRNDFVFKVPNIFVSK